MEQLGSTVAVAVSQAVRNTGAFLPNLFAAIIIAMVGVVVGTLFKKVLVRTLEMLKLDTWFDRTTLGQTLKKTEPGFALVHLIGELGKWFVVVVFLIPAVEVLGLREVTLILRDILFYVPNVVIAVIIVFLGSVFSRFAYDFVLTGATGLGSNIARTLAVIARWSILIFVTLAALSRLGIAAELIRILFTGFVAMIALAGGLAFGLGGKELAGRLIEDIRKELGQR